MIKRTITYLLLLVVTGCHENRTKPEFILSKFSDDRKRYTLRERFNSPVTKEFICIFYEDKGATAAGKIMKLYSADSTSIDERYYGEHPLNVVRWNDSTI